MPLDTKTICRLLQNANRLELAKILGEVWETPLLDYADQKIIDEDNLNVSLTDSGYAYHINSKGVDKGSGFLEAIKMLEVDVNDTIAIGD